MENCCDSVVNIKTEIIKRIPTGINDVDWLYGYTDEKGGAWGLPVKKISLWAGVSGIGKSRSTIKLARSIVKKHYKILYIQNEDDINTFAGIVKKSAGKENINNFYISGANTLQTQIEDIRKIKPKVVFVDSINQMEDYGNGTKTNIENIINEYKKVCEELRIHVIFITQLNQNGTIKGSSVLRHLVDQVFSLKPSTIEGQFILHTIFKVGKEEIVKNRCGRAGENFYTIWKHEHKEAICCSNKRLTDHLWINTHKIRKHL